MLYDPKWEKQAETKADPFSLDSLIAWLEKQPPEDTYCYLSSGSCLMQRYFTAAGFKNVYMFTDCFYHGDAPIPRHVGQDELIRLGTGTKLPHGWNAIAHGYSSGWNFGAALNRARAALAA